MAIIWQETKAVPATIEWAKIEVEMQPDSEVDISHIDLSISTKNNLGKVYIEDIVFIEKQFQKCCAFIELPDAPHSYEGKAGLGLFVNETEDGLEFLPIVGGSGEIGPEGPMGPAGPAGPQGETGLTGPQGEQGEQGPIGPQGPQGLQGVEGPAGTDGVDGTAGTDGADGAIGPIGPQGPRGDVGFHWKGSWASSTAYVEGDTFEYQGSSYVCHTGSIAGTLPTTTASFSLMAAKGAAGTGGTGTGAATFLELTDTPSAYTGAAGMVPVVSPTEDGLSFATPPTGPQGEIGPAGPQGIQGEPGSQGPIGPEGPQGLQGVEGPQGDQGLQGIPGDIGPQGQTGEQGLQGVPGADGAQGLPGNDGAIGPAGPAGPEGPIGPQGPQGIQGETGATGPAGADGTNSAGVASLKIKDNLAMLGDIELVAGPGVILSQDDNFKTITIESTAGSGPITAQEILFDDFEGDPLFPTGTWYRTTAASLAGTTSLRAPVIGPSQTTELLYTFEIDTAGKVSFYHMVESESVSYDYFTFSVDGVEKLRAGGVKTAFSYFEEPLTAGVHTIRFFYRKDGSGVGGRDTVFIDNFTINDIKYAEGEKPLVIANAAQIRQVPIDKPTVEGTVPTFNGTAITWELPPGGGVTTELQGIDVDTTAQLDGYVLTFDAASGKLLLKPKPGGGGEPISQMLTLRTKNTMYGGIEYPFALTSTTYLPA